MAPLYLVSHVIAAYSITIESHDMVVRTNNLAPVILRAQQNDEEAYEHLYNAHADQLFRYLYVRCGNVSLAEEALGELWLRLVQYLPSFRVPASGVDQAFTAWLYTIARNQMIDLARSAKRDQYDIPEDLPAKDHDLDFSIDRQNTLRELQVALQQLTPEQREVIVLRFREDLSSSEVAIRVGRSESAVKALQHRALGALARLIGRTQNDEYTHDQALFSR
jgi:RNA polymerase sigma-70 factor, ECF subfamily